MPLPLIAQALFSKGLSLLGDAVLAKGQDFVEEKLGVKLSTASDKELMQAQFDHEEFLLEISIQKREQELEFQKAKEKGVTERWQADMLSDSRLSKNIRPITLIYILTAYTILAIGSAFGFDVTESYITLLGQWGMLVMTAYFGGRSLEKIVEMKEKGKQS